MRVGQKQEPRSHSALDAPQLPQTSSRKNGKTSIFSGAQKIELHNSTFFGIYIDINSAFVRQNGGMELGEWRVYLKNRYMIMKDQKWVRGQ